MCFNCLILVNERSRTRKRNRHDEGILLHVGSLKKFGTSVGCGVQHLIRMWNRVALGLQLETERMIFEPYLAIVEASGLLSLAAT